MLLLKVHVQSIIKISIIISSRVVIKKNEI